MRKEDAYEVASLAALIGSQLKNLDNMTVERTNNPANKINIHDFISRVQNPDTKVAPKGYLTQVPSGWAEPVPEHLVQQMAPDSPAFVPPPPETIQPVVNVNIPPPLVSQFPDTGAKATLPTAVSANEQKTSNKSFVDKTLLTRSDIDSIRNSLKNIDKTLAGMLECMKIDFVKIKKHD